ncbi:MAG TPA: DUF5916 domain-containing protein [Vicinamibacterales bacterium]
MLGRIRLVGSLLVAAVLVPAVLVAQPGQDGRQPIPDLQAIQASTPPEIDGALDDAVWQAPALPLGTWTSYNPLYGDTIPQLTSVWVAYDARFLYFAFRCNDPQPDRIKTSITRRDNIWNDDWVGLSLDALGTGQLAYHMMVNPSGVQLDLLNTSGSGEDEAPDWVWDSAGRVDAQGYTVEIRLPLQSIRFRGGERVRMGVLFWRRISRLGVSVSWPGLRPNEWVFQHHAPLVFSKLESRPTREVIPSATYAGAQLRHAPDRWGGLGGQAELGVSAKASITPTIVAEGTFNPDFSQVESDAFQVEVNQRYPVFFSEKRPFFMEGAGLFNVAGVGNGDASMSAAVHTRRIVDPIAGLKLTGTAGRFTFGTLAAVDEAGGRDLPELDPRAGRDRHFAVGRIQMSLAPGSFAGLIFTDTEHRPSYNRVAGADLNLRLPKSQQLTGMVLHSTSRDADGRSTRGLATQWNYGASTPRYDLYTQFEHYDRDFRMDTAFYNRTGFTNAWVFGAVSFYPSKEKVPWLRRVVPFAFTQGGRDRIQQGDEILNVSGVRLHFSRQGFLRVDYLAGREPWRGQRFRLGRTRIFGNVQAWRWLRFDANYNAGLAIFYDPDSPFQGTSRSTSFAVTFQPDARWTQQVEVQRVDFDREDDGRDVYALTIVNTRTTYQFTRRLFARGIAQYDSSRRRILVDFLGSYELRPGTVFFVGYGSLIEERAFLDGEWTNGSGRYYTTRRGLFLKTSYLYRF